MAMRRGTNVAALLLLCLLAAGSTRGAAGCPDDSVPSEDGRGCKCMPAETLALACPKHDCPAGQQALRVRDANPERPGSCCPLYECRNQDLVSWVTPEDQASSGGQCLDDSDRPRDNGEHWTKEDPCTNCTCESGVVHCHAVMCRSCDHPLPPLPGECCSRCEPLLPYDGDRACQPLRDCKLRCELGLDVDGAGCTFCRCRAGSQDAQNEVEEDFGCPALECELRCEHGLLLDENDCGICQCRPHTGCPVNLVCQRKCPQGYRTNRRGCPSCRCRGSCLDEANATRPEGARWSSEPCRSCLCELGGQISCNETVCELGCQDPEPAPPGRCCPLCPTPAADESRGWGTIQIVLVVVLALLCVLLMVHLVRGRFRARLAPSEADFAGFPQQYYKCVPVYESGHHHVPVLRHAEKIVPL